MPTARTANPTPIAICLCWKPWVARSSAYNGHLTTLFTNMGGGVDKYDATNGVSITAGGVKAAELQTIDNVWGGSGDDLIKGGAATMFCSAISAALAPSARPGTRRG